MIDSRKLMSSLESYVLDDRQYDETISLLDILWLILLLEYGEVLMDLMNLSYF